MPQRTRCNGSLAAHYRSLLNLSQLELAAKADISERVVRKAESGEFLRWSTLEALANALSSDSLQLKAADLTCDPLAVAQALKRSYTLYGIEIIRRCAPILSPSIVFAMHTDVNNIAFAGEFHGLEGMEKAIREGTEQFQDRMVRSERWSVDGNRALALCHEAFRLKGVENAPPLETWLLHEYLVTDAKVVRIDTYIDSLAWVRYLDQTGKTREEVIGSTGA
jgi:transcriptional regulator with XRE-family HTH domain